MATTADRVSKVLERLREMALQDEDAATAIADSLDYMLDDLHGDDFFGTEGQADPRGDFRSGEWTATSCVQGIDD